MIDANKLVAIRTALAGARSGTDAQRIALLTKTLEDLLAAMVASAQGQPSAPGLTVGPQGDVTIRASQRITLTTGASTITLTSQGDVSLKGNTVSTRSNSDVPIRGSKIRDETSGRVPVSGGKIGNN